jgi:hypothetical protein
MCSAFADAQQSADSLVAVAMRCTLGGVLAAACSAFSVLFAVDGAHVLLGVLLMRLAEVRGEEGEASQVHPHHHPPPPPSHHQQPSQGLQLK